ncbi:MAG: HNH endonuclease [Thermodesulfobacteriota bacterium]|jgi:hypothetical protein
MGFKREEVSVLLAQCHRRCCICHKFCGVKIETDHIVPKEESGDDSISNAIPVCFECHAEIHGYNDKHPRGRKFLPDELRLHKEQWITFCTERPQLLLEASHAIGVGPLQALIDELQFNRVVAGKYQIEELGCMYHITQFNRSINDGAIAILKEDIRDAILIAYYEMDATNSIVAALWHQPKGSNSWNVMANNIQARNRKLVGIIEGTIGQMLKFLGKEQ